MPSGCGRTPPAAFFFHAEAGCAFLGSLLYSNDQIEGIIVIRYRAKNLAGLMLSDNPEDG
jgi:hypothetical protein